MKKQFKTINKLKNLLIWPLICNLILAVLINLLTNSWNAISCFWGGLVAILPQAVFGFCVFKHSGALKSKQIWQGFMRGEALKLLLTAVLFSLVYKFLHINTIWFLFAFIYMQFIGLVISNILLKD